MVVVFAGEVIIAAEEGATDTTGSTVVVSGGLYKFVRNKFEQLQLAQRGNNRDVVYNETRSLRARVTAFSSLKTVIIYPFSLAKPQGLSRG